MRLLIATTNPGKVREIRAVLDGLPIALIALDDCGPVQEPVEDGRTFLENARKKALYYAGATGLLTVADDSGLEIHALDGLPGVESSRFNGATYPEKFARLYDLLAARGVSSSPARFVCAAVVAEPARILFEAIGTIDGTIAGAPRGTKGFGYDPIFFYPPFGQTLGELDLTEKTSVSHRGRALRRVRGFLERSQLST